MNEEILKLLKKLRKGYNKNLEDFKQDKGAYTKNDFLNSPSDFAEDIQGFLDDDDDCCYAWLQFPKLADWNYGNAIYTSLLEERLVLPRLVTAAKMYDQFVSLAVPMIETYRSNKILWTANQAGLYLGLNMMLGTWKAAERITRCYYHYLSTAAYEFASPGEDRWRSPWFLFNLMCEELGLEYDKSKLRYPEKMFPYDMTLEDIKTDDLELVDGMVTKLSHYHLANCGDKYIEGMTEDEYYDAEGEFESSKNWFFPYVIMAVLRLREKHGLENPTEFSHPLMQQPLAQLPKRRDIPAVEENEMAKKAIAKILKMHPEMEDYLTR